MKYFLVITQLVDRYFFDIVNTFASGGEVIIYNSPNLQYLDKYGQYVQHIEGIKYMSNFPINAKDMVLVTDNLNVRTEYENLFKSLIFVNYDYYGDVSNGIKKPYGMHPNIYKNKQHIFKTRNIKHDIMIGFAGNVSKEHYTNPIIRDIFNMPNRYETFHYLSNKLTELYSGDLNLNKLPKGGGKLVLLNKNYLAIEEEKWIDFIRRCRFFYTNGWCYNAYVS